MKPPGGGYTAADALLDGFSEMGITHLFVNFGSDHPEIIESLAKRRDEDRLEFELVVCPHESVAMAAAHGHSLVSRRPQAVIVHVDVGTQHLGGAVHNASRGRVPILVFAGETPFTIDGELFGTRNRFPQFLQDVPDQHGIVRSYMKWVGSMRTGQNARQLVRRALQIACSEPRGPVYLTGAREVLSEAVAQREAPPVTQWPALTLGTMPAQAAEDLIGHVAKAAYPLIVTSYCGRQPAAVAELVQFAETLGIGVIEENPSFTNFPGRHPLHLGNDAAALVEQADLIVVIDCDLPWVNTRVRLAPTTTVYHLDCDPLKTSMTLWHIPATRAFQVDSLEALRQINALLRHHASDREQVSGRTRRLGSARAEYAATGAPGGRGQIEGPTSLTPQTLLSTLAEFVDDETIIVDETVTSSPLVQKLLPRSRPATYFASGGGSLGFGVGASIGVKLAAPDRTVVCLTGDGSYLFGAPAAVYMVSRSAGAPFLTIIFNNGGWNATKQNVLRLHPDGIANRTGQFWVGLGQRANLAGIAAAAGDCLAQTVETLEALRPALREAFACVAQGRSAVVDVRLRPVTDD